MQRIADFVMPKQIVFGHLRDGMGHRIERSTNNHTQRALALYNGDPYGSSRVGLAFLRLNRLLRYAALPVLYAEVPVVIQSELMNADWPQHCNTIQRSLGQQPFAHISALKVNVILRDDEAIFQGWNVQTVRLGQSSYAKLLNLRQLIDCRYGSISNATQSIMELACVEVDYDSDPYRLAPRPYAPKVVLKLTVGEILDLEMDISFIRPKRIGGIQAHPFVSVHHRDVIRHHTFAARRMMHRIVRRFTSHSNRNMILQGDSNDP